MAKSDSVFVVTMGYYQEVEGAYSSLESVKDAVLSDVLLSVLDGEKYLYELGDDFRVTEWIDGEVANRFEVSCQGVDFSLGAKVTNRNKLLETLDLVCVTQR